MSKKTSAPPQQERIIEQFNNMIEELEKKYNIAYNRLIPLDLKKNREFTDSWYLDDDSSEDSVTERRYAEIAKNIKKDDKFSTYCLLYSEETYSEKALALFGELVNCVSKHLSGIVSLDMNTEYAIMRADSDFKSDTYEYLTDALSSHASAFKYIDSSFENRDPQDQFMTALKEVSFYNITSGYFTEIVKRAEDNIHKTTSMNELFGFDSSIRSLCIDQGIRIFSRMKVDSAEEIANTEIPLNIIYGDKAQSRIEDKLTCLNKKREILLAIKEYEKDIILNPDETQILTEKSDVGLYINRSKLGKKLGRTNIIAIIDDKGKKNKDLILTLEGIYMITGDHFVSSGCLLEYQNALFNKTNTITFIRKTKVTHKHYYTNTAVNMERLFALISEIVNILK